METRETVRPMTHGQFKGIVSTMVGAIPELTFEEAQAINGKQGAFVCDIEAVFAKYRNDHGTTPNLAEWRGFYEKYFGFTPDLSGFRIPEKREGFNRLIVIPKGMTAGRAYDTCTSNFQCWKYWDNLDEITNDRIPTEAYAIWVRDRKEADEENRSLSSDQLRERGENTETIIERLIHELKFFEETGDHLDHENYTLCAGSRRPDGHIPRVYWDPEDRELGVDWYGPDNQYDGLRARSVVS